MTTDTKYPNVQRKLVETGLDLLDFPTMIFYETGYSLHTLRQASRRSWRIGQNKPVRVLFFFYKGTFQERCLQHMGMKSLTAMAMEGKFSGEGLNSMGDADMMTSLARELVEQGHVGESANQIWRDLRNLREKLFEEAVPVVAITASTVSAAELDDMFAEAAVAVEEVVSPIAILPAPSPSPLRSSLPPYRRLRPSSLSFRDWPSLPARTPSATALRPTSIPIRWGCFSTQEGREFLPPTTERGMYET